VTRFGIKETSAARLVRAVVLESGDTDQMWDDYARAAWTAIAEPGDRIAGLAVSALGAAGALEFIDNSRTASQFVAALRNVGVEYIADRALDETDLAKALARWRPRQSVTVLSRAFEEAVRCGAQLLTPRSGLWPKSFDDLQLHTPHALWLRGSGDALAALPNSIALVGARAATGYGEQITMEASAGLVDRGFAIVSGAAYGIDGMAHRAALASRGLTMAFLAGGVDRFYPSGHDALLTRITERGAVLSELPCGEPPTKWRFLQRNRLIAAASAATIVMEAGWRSGSLNTAGHASALGRPLGAVPGPITSAASAGCHRLIREFDAVCVTTTDEMAELVPHNPLRPTLTEATDAPLPLGKPGRLERGDRPAAHVRVLDALSTRSPRSSTDVAARAGMSLASVQSVLGMLELEGIVVERETGWVSG
jgi:DNA processing protein